MNHMFTKPLTALAMGIACLLSTGWADTLDATADITFKGTSTLHDFEGSATSPHFVATFNENGEPGQAVIAAGTSIAVSNMSTDNKKRDKNMFKMLDLEHYARIEGKLPSTLVSEKQDTAAKLRLKICGETHDVTAVISDVRREGKQLNCKISFPVSLKAFHLKRPSVLGLIRVGDTVFVECSIHGEIGASTAGN